MALRRLRAQLLPVPARERTLKSALASAPASRPARAASVVRVKSHDSDSVEGRGGGGSPWSMMQAADGHGVAGWRATLAPPSQRGRVGARHVVPMEIDSDRGAGRSAANSLQRPQVV
jgi:hypothetical protein